MIELPPRLGMKVVYMPSYVPDNAYNCPLEEVSIPEGWVWTGEYRVPGFGEYIVASSVLNRPLPGAYYVSSDNWTQPRMILRRKTRKVLRSVKEWEVVPAGDPRIAQPGFIGEDSAREFLRTAPANYKLEDVSYV